MWNGTAATLKPKPTSNRPRPASRTPLEVDDIGAQVCGDLGEVGRPRRPVDERDAVDEDGRGERTEHEVLHGGLARLAAPQVHPGEDVQRDRHDLEGEEDEDQVVGRGHEHRADAASKASTWYSGPSIPSRTRKSFAIAEARTKMHDTSTRNAIAKPSTATESAIVVNGPTRLHVVPDHKRGDQRGDADRAGADRVERRRNLREYELAREEQHERSTDEDQLRQDRHVVHVRRDEDRRDHARRGSSLRPARGHMAGPRPGIRPAADAGAPRPPRG